MMLRQVLLFTVLLLGLFQLAWANTGKITGKVTDARTNEPLIGAIVRVEGSTLGSTTDLDGNYVILNVRPGEYTIRFSYIGYKTQLIEDVRVQTDMTVRLDAKLLQDNDLMGETVVLVAQRQLIQKDETGTRQTITGNEIKDLPVQNFAEVLSYQAGVVSTGRRDFNVRGGRSNEVSFMVDGIMVRDPVNGALATNIGNDVVQELTFLSGTFNAEYGNALSGVINVTTREGGDSFSGLVELNKTALSTPRDTLFRTPTRDLVSMRIDGPILPGKLTFVASGELFDQQRHTFFGYDRGNNLFTKLTWKPTNRTKINASYRTSEENYQNYSHAYKYIPDSLNTQRATSKQALITMTNSIANNLVLTSRFSVFDQYFFNGLDKPLEDYVFTVRYRNPEFVGEFFSSADPTSMQETRTITYNLRSDLLWQVDKYNEVKMGFQFQSHDVSWFEVVNIQAVRPYVTDITGRRPFEGALYIQDKIEKNAFVLNLGLRLDFANQRSRFREDPLDPSSEVDSKTMYQLSPRIGIAHPISENSILRFSYGRFFQNPDFRFVYENNAYEFGTREPLFGNPDLDAQRTTAYEVGLIHQFDDRTAIKLTAYYKDIRGLVGTEFIPQGAEVNGRPVFTNYSRFVNEAYANVRGFEVNLDTRFNQFFDMVGMYTWSVTKGSASSEMEGFPRRIPSTRLYYLNFDKRHLWNVQANAQVGKNEGPKWLRQSRVTMVLNGSTGFPYTPSGRDIGFVENNSERYPVTWTVDLFASKAIPLKNGHELRFLANIQNLTDRRNARFVYTDTGRPDEFTIRPQSREWILNPNNWFPPRSATFGFRYTF